MSSDDFYVALFGLFKYTLGVEKLFGFGEHKSVRMCMCVHVCVAWQLGLKIKVLMHNC